MGCAGTGAGEREDQRMIDVLIADQRCARSSEVEPTYASRAGKPARKRRKAEEIAERIETVDI